MTTFIPAESLMSYSLYFRSRISFYELREIGKMLQRMFNVSGIDAVITYNIKEAINSYPDCFELIELWDEPYVRRKCDGKELESRFMSYLPLDIQKALDIV